MSQAKEGDQVTIHFTGKLRDQTEVMSSQEDGPFAFQIGDGTIFKKLNDAVVGMSAGEKKAISLKAEDAYGEIREDLIIEVEANQLPDGTEVGDVLADPNHEDEFWHVSKNEAGKATLDGNHPLAGQDIDFELELLTVESA